MVPYRSWVVVGYGSEGWQQRCNNYSAAVQKNRRGSQGPMKIFWKHVAASTVAIFHFLEDNHHPNMEYRQFAGAESNSALGLDIKWTQRDKLGVAICSQSKFSNLIVFLTCGIINLPLA